MIEVGAKAAGSNLFSQVSVARGQQPDIDHMGAVGPYALYITALQHPKQLGLHRQRQFADLVEEQRAPTGHLEFAQAILDGA